MRRDEVDGLLGEINVGLDQGKQLSQTVGGGVGQRAQLAAFEGSCGAELGIARGPDGGGDSLGLGQIHGPG